LFILALIISICFSEELIPVPHGFLPKECVNEVPSGSFISKEEGGFLNVKNPDGTSLKISPCRSTLKRIGDDGWINYGYFDGNSFNLFNGSWTVPSNPKTSSDNQTIFFFTGFVDAQGDEIIQPVLQWGPSEAGGGSYWTIASWWVTSSGQALYSQLQKVKAGDTIFGYMVESSTVAGTWEIGTSENDKPPTVLQVSQVIPQQMATVTLEAYNVLSCSDYPSDGSITFTGLTLEDSNIPTTPKWIPDILWTSCNEGMKSSKPSTVTLTF